MRKKILLFTCLCFVLGLNAQRINTKSLSGGFGLDDRNEKRWNKYINLGYAFQSFESKETKFLTLKSDYTAFLTLGATFILNREPVFNCIQFGIDWTALDLNVADYSKAYQQKYEIESNLYQMEAGMHVGPSITIDPGNEFVYRAYFRYAPSFSGFYDGDYKPYAYNYAGFFVTGINLSYLEFSLGLERRWGNADYEFKTEGDNGGIEKNNYNWRTKATRIYLSYRF